MSNRVSAPDTAATRAHAADWLELRAIASAPRGISQGDYLSALTLADGHDGDELFPDMDREIMDGEYDELVSAATDELRWRSEILGEIYPFVLRIRKRGWTLTYAPVPIPRNGKDPLLRRGQFTYLSSLLVSGIRFGKIVGLAPKAMKGIADRFQELTYLVSPSLFGGQSFWIAFPRPEHDGYGAALDRFVKNTGYGQRLAEGPPTQRSNKDGGVDIISWTTFGDGRPNFMLSYGQVATGRRWRDKAVKNKLESHFLKWLAKRPSVNYVPVMYIPHVMHESISTRPHATFIELQRDDASTLEALLGVVIDRVRLSKLASIDSAQPLEGPDAGFPAHARTLLVWTASVVKELQAH